jgi:hypothetical protein
MSFRNAPFAPPIPDRSRASRHRRVRDRRGRMCLQAPAAGSGYGRRDAHADVKAATDDTGSWRSDVPNRRHLTCH